MTAARDLPAEARGTAHELRLHGDLARPGLAAAASHLLLELADKLEDLTDRHNNQVVRRRTAERTVNSLWKSRARWIALYRRRGVLANRDRTAQHDRLAGAAEIAAGLRFLVAESEKQICEPVKPIEENHV